MISGPRIQDPGPHDTGSRTSRPETQDLRPRTPEPETQDPGSWILGPRTPGLEIPRPRIVGLQTQILGFWTQDQEPQDPSFLTFVFIKFLTSVFILLHIKNIFSLQEYCSIYSVSLILLRNMYKTLKTLKSKKNVERSNK